MSVPFSDAMGQGALADRPVNPGADKAGMRWIDENLNESWWSGSVWSVINSPQFAGQLLLVTTSNQSIATGTWTDIIWGSAGTKWPTELYQDSAPADIVGIDPALYNAAYIGIYTFALQVEFEASALCLYEAEIYDANSGGTPLTFGRCVQNQIGGGVNNVLSCSIARSFIGTGNVIRARVRQNSGGALNVIHASGADQMTRFEVLQQTN